MSMPAVSVAFELRLQSRERRFDLDMRFDSSQQRIVLFGPSGAGKSVTLQVVAGLLRPASGRIAIGERVLYDSRKGIDVPPRERRIGYVLQDHALFPHLSVRNNIAFGLRCLRRPWLDAAARRRVDAMLALFELEPLAAMRPQALSGGQRQRVALARALIVEPSLLLLDEPFAALDARLRQRMREQLRELQQRIGIPMLLISHDLQDVRSLAETLVVIDQGRVCRSLALDGTQARGDEATDTAELARLCGIA